jgi:hypothetical protein
MLYSSTPIKKNHIEKQFSADFKEVGISAVGGDACILVFNQNGTNLKVTPIGLFKMPNNIEKVLKSCKGADRVF